MPQNWIEPLELGTKVPHYGKIGAVLFTMGERYYMLLDKHGSVALMPAKDIERMVRRPSSPERSSK